MQLDDRAALNSRGAVDHGGAGARRAKREREGSRRQSAASDAKASAIRHPAAVPAPGECQPRLTN